MAENICLPAVISGQRPPEYASRLEDILKLVGLGDDRYKQPSQLSGGQQQRAAIARASFIEPAVLLADEPTGNVDMRTGQEILGLFADAQRELGQTIVMVTHDPQRLRRRSGAVASRAGGRPSRPGPEVPRRGQKQSGPPDPTPHGPAVVGAVRRRGVAVRSLSSVAMRNLARRKGRYALTALGTALGVAVLFGVLVSGGATSSALNQAAKAGAGRTDVYVNTVGTFDSALPPNTDKRVAALPQVHDVIPSVGFPQQHRPTGRVKPGLESTSTATSFPWPGLDPASFRIAHSFDVTRGRIFKPGAAEVALGRGRRQAHRRPVGRDDCRRHSHRQADPWPSSVC